MRRLVVLTAVVCGFAAAPGLANAACERQAVHHPFTSYLDPFPYIAVSGGSFESGAPGWSLSGGSRVVSGGNGTIGGSASLRIPAGGSATSPTVCVGILHPTLRFFVLRESAALNGLRVEVLFTGLLGQPMSLELLPGVLGTGAWSPTLPQVTLGSVLPALSLDGLTAHVRFRFTPKSGLLGLGLFGSAAYRIDDVYVDPWFNE